MRFNITSRFGAIEPVRKGPHTGIDLAMPEGTLLRSVSEGRVIQIYTGEGTLGKGVRIMNEGGLEFVYGHMNYVGVKVGDVVKFGQNLGLSGNTGNSTGPHLHFEVVQNGEHLNPEQYIATLDAITGDGFYYNPEKANSKDEIMDIGMQEKIDACMGGVEKPPLWDIQGMIDYKFDLQVCEIKVEITEKFFAFLEASQELLLGMSYTMALVGGGLLIVAKALGSTRAMKYFGGLQVLHVFIRGFLGD